MRYEIICRGSLDEEALELGRSCGAEELALGSKILGSKILGSKTLGSKTLERSILGKTLPGIPHEDYRVLVTAAALKLARARGTQTPGTLDYARAKATVDAALVARGIGIVIPKARPGRVTR